MLLVWFSYAQKAFTTSMSEKKEGDFWQVCANWRERLCVVKVSPVLNQMSQLLIMLSPCLP